MFALASLARTAVLCLPLLSIPSGSAAASTSHGAVTAKKGKKARKGKKRKKGARARARARGLCEALICTERQEEQVSTRLLALEFELRDARKGRAALQTALSRELAKETPSKKELARVRRELTRMQAAASQASFDALLDIHGVLDTSQREQLAKLVERGGLRRLLRPARRRGHGRR